MRSKKREKIDDQRHDFDARSHKRYAYIDWLDNNSSWSQSAYHIPDEYADFFASFQTTIQEAINSIDIDGKQNGDVLDSIIDAEAHIALRKIRLMRDTSILLWKSPLPKRPICISSERSLRFLSARLKSLTTI